MRECFFYLPVSLLLSDDFLLLGELALLQAHQDVLVTTVRHYVVGYDHLSVLLCTHSKVDEVGVTLIELLKGRFSLHDQVGNEGSVLHGGDFVLWESLHWDAYREMITLELGLRLNF